jgi:hypothetical protein
MRKSVASMARCAAFRALALLLVLTAMGGFGARSAGANESPPDHFLLDMVHNNPGEPAFATKWSRPAYLKGRGYTGEVPKWFVQCAITYESWDPALVPSGSPIGEWVRHEAGLISSALQEARRNGLPVYPFTDFLVVPKVLLEKYGADMKTGGHLDVTRPKTQEVIRAQIREVFDRFPDLAGLTVRFGETYLHDTPFHVGERPMPPDGEAAIKGHIALIRLLREEICVKRGKMLFYRTWDFGHFHDDPAFYLAVTDAIEPHPNLVFSVKHQKGDFLRLSPFNPTLMIGKHRQIVEVQSQREAYGKGAHPYYIGQGVIEGWEEYSWLMNGRKPQGLRDIISHPNFAGVWTWSRGGGWEGPSIANELWCDLNTFVIAEFVRHPERSEAQVFSEVCRREYSLSEADIVLMRELSLLSAAAVVRGQQSFQGAVNPWWCRDQYLETPDLTAIIAAGRMPAALAEKAEAVRMFSRIETLARQIRFPDRANQDFAETSATYGRIKYALFEQIWKITVLGTTGAPGGRYDLGQLSAAISEYDRLWAEWRSLKDRHPGCPTLYRDIASPFSGAPGIGQTVANLRRLLPRP